MHLIAHATDLELSRADFQGNVSLIGNAFISPANIASLLGSASLSAETAEALAANLFMDAQVGLPALVVVTPSGGMVFAEVLILAGNAALAALISQGFTFNEAVSLAGGAVLSETAHKTAEALLNLQSVSVLPVSAKLDSVGSVGLGTQAALIQSGNLILPCSVVILADSALPLSGGLTLCNAVALTGNAQVIQLGTLAVVIPDASRTVIIPRENRFPAIESETRIMLVEPEHRFVNVQAETRFTRVTREERLCEVE